MLRSLSRLFPLLALLLTALGSSGRAVAQDRPHHATGVAQFAANQSDFTGSGYATHLGNYSEVGSVSFAPTGTPGVFAVTGFNYYIAANGDRLDAALAGTVDMTTGAIDATATYIGGTGRFVAATGASVLTGQLLPGGAVTITANGIIRF